MTIRPLTCVQTDPSASCPSPPHLLVCRPVVLITCNGWHEASHCQALAVFTSLSLTLSFLPLWVRWNDVSPRKSAVNPQTELGPSPELPKQQAVHSSGAQLCWHPWLRLTLFSAPQRMGGCILYLWTLKPQPVTGAQQMPADWVNQWQFIYFLDSDVRKKLLTLLTKQNKNVCGGIGKMGWDGWVQVPQSEQQIPCLWGKAGVWEGADLPCPPPGVVPSALTQRWVTKSQRHHHLESMQGD